MPEDYETSTKNLTEESLANKIISKSYQHRRLIRTSNVSIADARRPIYAVLSEPMKGNLVNDKSKIESAGYIPKAHVQFLEQAGIRVVPLNYHASEE